MKIVGVIPARLKSTRLPRKALIDIEGLPMVVHVLKRAQMSPVLDKVYVATDSQEIQGIVTSYGGEVVMTSEKHRNGTERIAEAAKDFEADIVVDIQGDEPLLDPGHIECVIQPLLKERDVQVSVLVTPYIAKNSSSDIKAVLDENNNILYCSRADLPSDARSKVPVMWKMSFIVPYRKKFLMRYISWSETPLELIEYIEHLRILEKGYKIRAVPIQYAHISVDTPDDLQKVRKIMKVDPIRMKYL